MIELFKILQSAVASFYPSLTSNSHHTGVQDLIGFSRILWDLARFHIILSLTL